MMLMVQPGGPPLQRAGDYLNCYDVLRVFCDV